MFIRLTSPLTIFFLFPLKMKLRLKGRRCDTTEEIHAESQEVINTLTFENFQGCMKSWETLWDRFIHTQRNYFKGDFVNLELYDKIYFMVKFPEIFGSTSCYWAG
jgi:hypothetical protein